MTLPDKDTLDTYGGALNDYELGVVDPTTDRGAAAANKAYASTAMMTRTAARCYAAFVTAATTGAMVLSEHDALWGNTSGVAPVLARASTGVFTVTWPTSVTDPLGVAHTLALRRGTLLEVAGATAYHVQVARTAANIVTVRVFDMAGVAADAAGLAVCVGAL